MSCPVLTPLQKLHALLKESANASQHRLESYEKTPALTRARDSHEADYDHSDLEPMW